MDVFAARRARRTPSRGFTMIELMTALAIIAVVGAFAVPALRTMIRNNRLTAVSNDLLGSLQTARTEAVKRQAQVVLCAVPDATAAQPTCSLSGATGWVVFQDTNANWSIDPNEPIIDRRAAIDPTITARADGGMIGFAPTGFAVPTAVVTPLRNVVFCDSRGIVALGTNSSTARAVRISVTGRARVASTVSDVTAALASGVSCP